MLVCRFFRILSSCTGHTLLDIPMKVFILLFLMKIVTTHPMIYSTFRIKTSLDIAISLKQNYSTTPQCLLYFPTILFLSSLVIGWWPQPQILTANHCDTEPRISYDSSRVYPGKLSSVDAFSITDQRTTDRPRNGVFFETEMPLSKLVNESLCLPPQGSWRVNFLVFDLRPVDVTISWWGHSICTRGRWFCRIARMMSLLMPKSGGSTRASDPVRWQEGRSLYNLR